MKEASIRLRTGRSTGLLVGVGRERSVILRGKLTRQLAACCIARLIVLGTENFTEPIVIYIDSPGGSVADALPVLSTLSGLKSPIATFCTRQAGGPALAIACAGMAGCRAVVADARLFFSPPRASKSDGALGGDERFLHILTERVAADTGIPENEVHAWLERGAQFTPQEALAFGLIDSISEKPVLPKPKGNSGS